MSLFNYILNSTYYKILNFTDNFIKFYCERFGGFCLFVWCVFLFSKLFSSLEQNKSVYLNLNWSCIASVSDAGKDAARDRASIAGHIKLGWKCIKYSMFIC